MKTFLYWLPVALGIALLSSLAYIQRTKALRGENDFVQLYTGAKLVGTPDLYSRTANIATVKTTLGFMMESVVYTRPPFYAAILKPLALLPYRVAYTVFSLASLSSILWFIIRFSKECPPLPFFAAMSIPVLTALCGGQDTPFLLAILGGSILLTRRNRDFLAGLLLSFCAIKFHLFLFIPALLLVKKRWRILGGAATGLLILTQVGVLVAGADSMRQYLNVLRDPWINPSATVMPNLHGLVTTLHGNLYLELMLVAGVFIGLIWIMRQTNNFEFLLAATIVSSLLVSFHSNVSDDIVLLVAFVAVFKTCSNSLLRGASALILTPIPYFMVLADAPYSAFLPIVLLLLLGMFGVARGGIFAPVLASERVPCASCT